MLVVLLCSGARLVCQANRILLSALMPSIARELGLSIPVRFRSLRSFADAHSCGPCQVQGWLSGLFALGYFLTQTLGGPHHHHSHGCGLTMRTWPWQASSRTNTAATRSCFLRSLVRAARGSLLCRDERWIVDNR